MSLMRPLATCWRSTRHDRIVPQAVRNLATTTTTAPPAEPPPPPPSPAANPTGGGPSRHNPNFAHTPRTERRLIEQQKIYPIGSRRRRAALATSKHIPFSQLPYQCFQEARAVLRDDRAMKEKEIETMRGRIASLEAKTGEGESEVEMMQRQHRIKSMKNRLEAWKILADINDPLVKKRFEDGMGDMNKPIYRHLADLKWRQYPRKVLMQRITQMDVVPDVLPTIDPSYSTAIRFNTPTRRIKVPHGDFVHSSVSEHAPSLTLQPYDKGERFVTIAVVNPDVPNVEKDGFDYRCHFLACNIPVSPSQTSVDLSTLDAETQVLQPWLSPYVQKGLPYQRHALFVLEQDAAILNKNYTKQTRETKLPTIDIAKLKTHEPGFAHREDFILRSLVDKLRLRPVGVDFFRSLWDDGTADIMQKYGIVGEDVEFKRKRVDPLPYQRLKGSRFT